MAATPDTEPMLDLLRARFRHALTARPVLRTVAADPSLQRYESLLHVARFWMPLRHRAGSDDLLLEELQRLASGPDWSGSEAYAELLGSGYLDRWD